MNPLLLSHEIGVLILGLGVLLADLWLPAAERRKLGYTAAAGLAAVLVFSVVTFDLASVGTQYAFGGMFVLDSLALFFKRLFLLAAVLVIIIAIEFSDRLEAGLSEYFALTLFALSGMLFAASANDFALLFVALELVTVSFYVLVSFQRGRVASLEAGVKYLILGALSSAFTVFGIALVWGTTTRFNLTELAAVSAQYADNPVFVIGLLMVMVGLGFKIAAVPFQMWAPDVYQGAPTPTTAFLAIGSKAAGFVLLLRVLFVAAPSVAAQWSTLLMLVAGATILYGNFCAIPQRDLKRLLGYSSIAHAGYLLLGVAALNAEGRGAILFYLAGYLFSVLGAFAVITLVSRQGESTDVSVLAGLHQRSPLLAVTLTLAMVSLAGIPPLAGFFGKFFLLKSVLAQMPVNHAYLWLALVALVGVVISFYYYFGIVRAIYWGQGDPEAPPLVYGRTFRAVLAVCLVGMLYLGLYPATLLGFAEAAAGPLR